MRKIYILSLILMINFYFFSLAIPPAQAITSLTDGLGDCITDGSCELDDFMRIAVNVSQIILGIVGALTLLFFVYGGVVFLTSSGNKEMVTKGRNIIVGSIIGLVIVFASYTIIGFVITKFVPDSANWSENTTWF